MISQFSAHPCGATGIDFDWNAGEDTAQAQQRFRQVNAASIEPHLADRFLVCSGALLQD
jgi:hypothetical protein